MVRFVDAKEAPRPAADLDADRCVENAQVPLLHRVVVARVQDEVSKLRRCHDCLFSAGSASTRVSKVEWAIEAAGPSSTLGTTPSFVKDAFVLMFG